MLQCFQQLKKVRLKFSKVQVNQKADVGGFFFSWDFIILLPIQNSFTITVKFYSKLNS